MMAVTTIIIVIVTSLNFSDLRFRNYIDYFKLKQAPVYDDWSPLSVSWFDLH